MPSEVINFAFKSKVTKHIGISKISIYWTSKRAGRRYFTKQAIAKAIPFLINKYFFIFFPIDNMIFKQDVVIEMGNDPAPFWLRLNQISLFL